MEHQIITMDIKTNNGNLMTTSSGQWEKQFDGLWMVSIQCDMNLDSRREQTGYIIASEMQIVFLGIIPVSSSACNFWLGILKSTLILNHIFIWDRAS